MTPQRLEPPQPPQVAGPSASPIPADVAATLRDARAVLRDVAPIWCFLYGKDEAAAVVAVCQRITDTLEGAA